MWQSKRIWTGGEAVPQISEREFKRLPLRAHQFLAGVPLHDVWAVDLPSPRAGITLDEFLRVANDRIYTPTPVMRGLLDLGLLIGRLFGCDCPRRPRLERRSPGCSIVFYIDAEQANVCNLHVAQRPLIKRRSTASSDTDVTGDSKKSSSRPWAATNLNSLNPLYPSEN